MIALAQRAQLGLEAFRVVMPPVHHLPALRLERDPPVLEGGHEPRGAQAATTCGDRPRGVGTPPARSWPRNWGRGRGVLLRLGSDAGGIAPVARGEEGRKVRHDDHSWISLFRGAGRPARPIFLRGCRARCAVASRPAGGLHVELPDRGNRPTVRRPHLEQHSRVALLQRQRGLHARTGRQQEYASTMSRNARNVPVLRGGTATRSPGRREPPSHGRGRPASVIGPATGPTTAYSPRRGTRGRAPGCVAADRGVRGTPA